MNKLEMAMPILLKLIEVNKTGFDAEGIAIYTFEILDAMQAEADKRDKAVEAKEWQPDWSVAPEWAEYAGVTANIFGVATGTVFFGDSPSVNKTSDCSYYVGGGLSHIIEDTFGYVGKWQDSLHKRP